MSEFGRWLMAIISEMGMSQREFGRRAGISESLVGYWVRNPEANPDAESIRRVVEYLNRSGYDVTLAEAMRRAGYLDVTHVNGNDGVRELLKVYEQLTPRNQKFLVQLARDFRDLFGA